MIASERVPPLLSRTDDDPGRRGRLEGRVARLSRIEVEAALVWAGEPIRPTDDERGLRARLVEALEAGRLTLACCEVWTTPERRD